MYVRDMNAGSLADRAAASVDARRDTHPDDDGLALILLGQDGPPDLDDLVGELNQRGVAFLGGVFPAVIEGCNLRRRGAIIRTLPLLCGPFSVDMRGSEAGAGEGEGRRAPALTVPEPLTEAVARQAAATHGAGGATAIVLVDGQAGPIDLLLAELFSALGDRVSYFGAGAGRLLAGGGLDHGRPCLFSPAGACADAAVVAVTRLRSRLSFRHGWQIHSGPVVATRTDRNVIHELNWRPAIDIYREIIEPGAARPIPAERLFDIARSHPFGIYKEGAERVVRVALRLDEATGAVACGGEVLENSVLDILETSTHGLLDAAREAAAACARQVAAGAPAEAVLVADCVSRQLLLEEAFADELIAVADELKDAAGPDGEPLEVEGVLSLGEISSDGEGYLEFLNQTIVLDALADDALYE